MNRGIVYIVGGKKYSEWALRSIVSLRRNGGEAGQLPVTVYFIGDMYYHQCFHKYNCECIEQDSGDKVSHHAHRKAKSIIMQEQPYDQYIMIDADTFIQGDFVGLFDAIPDSGVAGIEDGNFKSHLQMAEFLFLTKKGKVRKDVQGVVKELLGVDYGSDDDFPPYYNVGVIGFSRYASAEIGKELFPLLQRLSESDLYNQHDEQLPINSIMYHKKIKGIAADPIYNYTRSRMRKNKKNGLHKKVRDNVRIIHNRHFPHEADWVDVAKIENEWHRVMIDESSVGISAS